MTNLWPSINTLRMEATRLRQTSRRVEAAEDMDIAATLLEAAGKALEAKDKYIKNGLSEWGNYMTAIGALTEAALRGSSNVGIGRQSDGPGSSPGPRFSALPDEVKP